MHSDDNFNSAEETDIGAIPLSEAIKIALENRLFIILFALSVAVCAAIITLLMPNKYTATTTTLPAAGDSRTGGIASLLESSPALDIINLGQDKNSPSMLYPEILKSRMITEEVLKKEYTFDIGGNNMTTDLYEYLDENDPDLAYEALLARTSIEYNKKNGIVTLSITTEMPELSAAVANYYIEMLDEFNKHNRKSGARIKREFVEQRMTENKVELSDAEEALKSFRENNRNYLQMTDPQLMMEHDRLLREVAVKTQVYQMLAEEYELSAIQEKKESPVIQILDLARIPSVKSSPARAKTTILALIFGAMMAAGLSVANHIYFPRERRYDLTRVLNRVRFIRTPEEKVVEIER